MVAFNRPILFLITFLLSILVALLHWFRHKNPTYIYSSLNLVSGQSKNNWYSKFLKLLRALAILSLCIALGQPRKPDERSKLPVEGIDIILALDASGSMNQLEDSGQTRFNVVKNTAKDFINRRGADEIGIVLFGKYAISRCPLTLDKELLNSILVNTEIGIVDPDGTVISRALLTAINKLKNSNAKSKIIILLSDGLPSPNDIDPNLPLDLAKKLGIKIYTIGIGEYIIDPHSVFSPVPIVVPLNWDLLKQIAKRTEGEFFLAKEASDLKAIYDKIDQLEKSNLNSPIFGKYTEYFYLFAWLALILLFLELLISSTIWRFL